MTLEAASFLSQIVAAFAVVASLIYLALQMRQTSRNQQAQMHQSRLHIVRDLALRLADPEFATTWRAGATAEPSMDTLDCLRPLRMPIWRGSRSSFASGGRA
jgi:hypothetical protein